MGQEANYAAIIIAFTALSFLSTLARCISRFAIIKQAGPDDFLTIGAFLILLSMTVCNLLRGLLSVQPHQIDANLSE